jgi:pimeloyl-ACP methyl ester carboxylesterase
MGTAISLDGYFTGMSDSNPSQIDRPLQARRDSEAGTLQRGHGAFLAYRRRQAVAAGRQKPTIVFLSGFKSDMTGGKATALDGFCDAEGLGLLRFDYSGHGASSGDFLDGTISLWTEDALAAIDALTDGPLILVGSSMGGWIMLLAALERRARIAGLIGVAPAPDFTEDLIWKQLRDDERARLMRDGRLEQASEYSAEPTVITRKLIEDGRRHLLLAQSIALDLPVRLLHGMADPDVPYQHSLRLAERLESRDVTVTLIKDGDHRLSREADLARLCAAVAELAQLPAPSSARNPTR